MVKCQVCECVCIVWEWPSWLDIMLNSQQTSSFLYPLCCLEESLWPFSEEYIIVWHPTSTFAFSLKVTIRNSYLAPQYHLPGLFVWDLVSQQVPSSYVVWRYASVSSENISLAFNTFQRIASQRSTFTLVFVPWLNIVVILSLRKKINKKNPALILYYSFSFFLDTTSEMYGANQI